MKNKILFVINSFECGGTNRSLQNLLSLLNAQDIQSDIFAFSHKGEYISEFENAKILRRDRRLELLLSSLTNWSGLEKCVAGILKAINILTKGRFRDKLFNLCANRLLREKYDAVIAFSEGLPTMFVSGLNHHNKIAWIHCDYASHYGIAVRERDHAIYSKLHTIVCVSEFTKSSFVSIFPDFVNRVVAIYNTMNADYILSQSKASNDSIYDKDYFNIVSIGRIDPIKRFSLIPDIVAELLKDNINIRWYIIGPKYNKEESQKIAYSILNNGVKDNVILLGEKSNPYPYILQADLLVLTSKSEACPYVLNEAKVLGIPVLSSNFGSAAEFIKDGVDGIIDAVDNFPTRILELYNNKNEQYSNIKECLETFNYPNDEIVQQIIDLIKSR